MNLLNCSVEDLKEIITLKERDEKLKKEIDINQKTIDEMIKKQHLDRKERGEIQDILNNFTDYKRSQNEKNTKPMVNSFKDLKVGDKFWYEHEKDSLYAAKIDAINKEGDYKITYGNILHCDYPRWNRILTVNNFYNKCKTFDGEDEMFDTLYTFDPTNWKLTNLSINGVDKEIKGAGLPKAYLHIAHCLGISSKELINNTFEKMKCSKEEFENSRPTKYPIHPDGEEIYIMGVSNLRCITQITKMLNNDKFDKIVKNINIKMSFRNLYTEKQRTIHL
tara:strand:- start:2566 stop:3399 length:834 start_codon:yes stop_codon:yes gene_type:complete